MLGMPCIRSCGAMGHCTAYCPVMRGLRATGVLGGPHHIPVIRCLTATPVLNPLSSRCSLLAATGVLMAGGVFFGLGVALFLIFLLTDVISCCCCRRKITKGDYEELKSKQGCVRKCLGPRCGFLAVDALMFILAAVALGSVYVFKEGLGELLTGALALATQLVDTNALFGTMSGSMLDYASAASALESAAQAQGTPPDADTIYAIGLLSGVSTVVSDAVSSSPIQAVANAVSGLVTGTVDVNLIKDMAFAAAGGVIGVFLAYLLIAPLTLLGKRCCACCRRAFGVCDLLALAFVWVVTGLFMVLGLLTADVCAAPGQSIVRVLNTTGAAPELALQTLQYYTSCPEGPELVGGALLAQQMNDAMLLADTTAAALLANATADPNLAWAITYVQAVVDAIPAPLEVSGYIAGNLSCAGVYPSYYETINALCTKATPGIIGVWALGVVCSILMIFLSSFAARLCRFHPGDVETPTLKSDSAIASDHVVSPVRVSKAGVAPSVTAGAATKPGAHSKTAGDYAGPQSV